MLAAPLTVFVLRALADAPMSLVELRGEIGSPPQSTMRGHLAALAEIGVVKKRRQNTFPGTLSYELTAAGHELLSVAETVEAWLTTAPEGSLSFGTVAAKSAIRALVEGWTTSILRALAARPLSPTELDKLLTGIGYHAIERRLEAMRLIGLVETMPGNGRGTPHVITEWTRRAVGPLIAAARWESLHLRGQVKSITNRDAETALLLIVPLVRLPAEQTGSCLLAVEIRNGDNGGLAGVMAGVKEGMIVSCVPRLAERPDAWATGSSTAWFAAMIESDISRLELGGQAPLACGIVERLHEELFGVRVRSLS
jgi:DNA-binding HxlR family transcriptional regulator